LPGNIATFLTTNNQQPYESNWTNLVSTINNKLVPNYEENAIGFIDTVETTSLGYVQPANWVEFFRAGYFEISLKTNKQNCIIASGTSQYRLGQPNILGNVLGSQLSNSSIINENMVSDDATSPIIAASDYPKYYGSDLDYGLIDLNIKIKNGKLCLEYVDDFNEDAISFELIGLNNIADGNWHHIVINFTRPGLIKKHGSKFDRKSIEFWVDGQLDKRFNNEIIDKNILYPTIKYLFNNPKDLALSVYKNQNVWDNLDYPTNNTTRIGAVYAGFREIFEESNLSFWTTLLNSDVSVNSFNGAIHTLAHGINIPISIYEIQQRFSLWKEETKRFAKAKTAAATLIQPAVSTNKKKALKLFWNNLINNGKNGIELDSNYQVESYSITHKVKNSSTELFNLDMANEIELNVLQNVRAAFKDNILTIGPGKVLLSNTSEAYINAVEPFSGSASQMNPKNNIQYDTVTNYDDYKQTAGNAFVGPRNDLTFSGIQLQTGDRILLTNQLNSKENGVWIYNGLDNELTRPSDIGINNLNNSVVYVSDGHYANTYWILENTISGIGESQNWVNVNNNPLNYPKSQPVYLSRWEDAYGNERFINILDDLNINKYDLIVFMNYPESNEEIKEHFINESEFKVTKKYKDFINSLKVACSNGASLYVSSPKLAEDMGIVSKFTIIDQEIEIGDGRSAVVNPFQFDESANTYFDTHRQNAYHLDTEIAGLTDRETWIMTEAINYIPKDEYEYEQWHLKYSYRQFGLQEGNEFLIPSLAVRQVATKDDLPGSRANNKASSELYVVSPADVRAGVIVTSLANTYYHGATIVNNQYDDYATTIIVHNGQQLGGMPINGKIFVNCVEDGYTMSREEYNKGIIQVIPNNDPNETNARRQWQYSTSRLNRSPKRVNVRELTTFGQTTPTNGGGGPIVQSATNSSNGIIRSETDKGNKDYQSDLYPQETEEIYPVQEIPVLSMTWLGLKWLEG
jgi:hypothetical protein